MLVKTATLALLLSTFLSSPAFSQISGTGTAPSYTAQGIVNGATQTVEALAPNTIAMLYGTNLAFSQRGVTPADLVGNSLPTTLDGVGVWVNAIPCGLFLVSPGQINFLVPYELIAGTVSVVVARQGVAGPSVKIQLNNTSPGLFLWGNNIPLAVHLDGSLISSDSPAKAGEIVVIFAAGLGRTTPDTISGRLPAAAASLYYASQFKVLLNGSEVPNADILYAGLAPGFAGLYQINLKLPPDVVPNPEIRLAMGEQGELVSPASIQLAVQ